MATKKNESQTSKPQKESALSRYKLKFEDKNKKFHASATLGKKELLIVRVGNIVLGAIVNFTFDLFAAIKVIIRRVM